jgi:hypothetical protein
MVVEDKTIGWYCHNTGQHQLGFSVLCVPRQLLLYCGLRKISSGANLELESLRTVGESGTLKGAQVMVAHCPVIIEVDCCEELYSFTNQAFLAIGCLPRVIAIAVSTIINVLLVQMHLLLLLLLQ